VVVDQPRAEVLPVDPLGDRLVVRIRNQQREAEAAQQPLRRAFPRALVLAHLDQFTRERQFLLADRQGRAQRLADADLRGVDVAAASTQAVDLVDQGRVLLAALAEPEVLLTLAVVEIRDPLAQALGPGRDALTLDEERRFVGGWRLVDPGQQFRVTVGLLSALRPVLLEPADLRGQLLEAVTAVVAQRALQLRDLGARRVALRIEALELCVEPRGLVGEQRQAPVQQFALEPGEPGAQRVAIRAQGLDFGDLCGVTAAVLDQRREQRDLPLGLQHRLVRAVQVVEVPDQRLDPVADVEGLQHVVAHEVGQVSGETAPAPARARCRSDGGTTRRRAGSCRTDPPRPRAASCAARRCRYRSR